MCSDCQLLENSIERAIADQVICAEVSRKLLENPPKYFNSPELKKLAKASYKASMRAHIEFGQDLKKLLKRHREICNE